MTESRIIEILAENDCYPTVKRITAIKQAVNEALDEAANKVLEIGAYGESVADDDILNLKVE